LAIWGSAAFAGQDGRQEGRIRDAQLRVERAAAPLGETVAAARLAGTFRVSAQVVADLRDQKLDLGEIAVVLALAEAGRTSPDAVLGLWVNGRLTWAEIAQRLKVEVRTLLRRLDAARRELARQVR
jgi:hypothetical protein